jgi:hypothetical protein
LVECGSEKGADDFVSILFLFRSLCVSDFIVTDWFVGSALEWLISGRACEIEHIDTGLCLMELLEDAYNKYNSLTPYYS